MPRHDHPRSQKLVPLPRSVYRPAADVVAPRLLGHWLVRNTTEGLCGGLIVETEAYLADDPACHGFNGETKRNRSMFGPPGHAYVYFIYGNHFCVNAVCRPRGHGEAVLIRAIEANFDEAMMRQRRAVTRRELLTSGPGRLCAALDITRALDGVDLCATDSPLFIARNPECADFLKHHGPMVKTTRVGLSRAAEALLRFYVAGSSYVSRRTAREIVGRG